MAKCRVCGEESDLISGNLGVCKKCIRDKWDEARGFAEGVHRDARERFGLPPKPPERGKLCGLCSNECRIPKNGKGYCGLTENRDGKIVRLAGTPEKGLLEYYYDPHPTNCVGAWCCPASGLGYPKFSVSKEPEHNHYNLSVFYGACCLDCLFCQNWNFKYLTQGLKPLVSARELASKIKEETTCVCFFGGDPSPQLPHALATARIARKKFPDKILRFCLETNGLENPKLLKQFAEISLESGGNIKFDLKFWNENLSLALCGVSNKPVYKNFQSLASMHEQREIPLLIASTLLIPGYVDKNEVGKIAKFIASIDENIPYSLLAFYPCFVLNDLPTTSRRLAKECYEAAKKSGLKRVKLGNIHLLC